MVSTSRAYPLFSPWKEAPDRTHTRARLLGSSPLAIARLRAW
jgi:hypothetical protein